MGFVIFLGGFIAAFVCAALALFGLATLIIALFTFDNKADKFTVICALLGWFIIGLYVASLF